MFAGPYLSCSHHQLHWNQRAQPQTCDKEPLFLLVLGAGRAVSSRLVVKLPSLPKLRPKLKLFTGDVNQNDSWNVNVNVNNGRRESEDMAEAAGGFNVCRTQRLPQRACIAKENLDTPILGQMLTPKQP